jgi:two-component system alkaline phosphatase synthesis response regulator PhoP
MSNYRILLVEDEEHLLEALKLNLELEGYHVTTATDGKKALKLFKEERLNLVILDVMLPEIDGFKVAETIRLENSDIPILFLTAKNTSEDRVAGLKRGADDYLTKPFNLEELILRVGILVKRSLKGEEHKQLNSYKIGDKTINFNNYELVDVNGNVTSLTKKETMLLKLLIERKGEAVSRETILETVWNYDVYPSTRTIDNFILSFRKYFEQDSKNPKHFHSIRGVGYKYTD